MTSACSRCALADSKHASRIVHNEVDSSSSLFGFANTTACTDIVIIEPKFTQLVPLTAQICQLVQWNAMGLTRIVYESELQQDV